MEQILQSSGRPVPSQKKTVLITGCSPGGIGHALAKSFHARGAALRCSSPDVDFTNNGDLGLHVFATARRAEALEDLKAIGIDTIVLEVTDASQVQTARKDVEQRSGGRLDILVNNAGRNYTVPALDVNFEEVQSTFNTNLFAVMRICQEFSPLLVKAKGTIINIGSVAAEVPYIFGSVYNASKAALHSYSNTLRVELQPYEVKVMVVVTGGIESNIARTDRELPENSLYLPVNAEYQRRLKHSQEGAMPASTYAESVVKAALQRSPTRELWKGNKTLLVWVTSRFMPRWLGDLYFARLFNLWKITEYLKTARKEK